MKDRPITALRFTRGLRVAALQIARSTISAPVESGSVSSQPSRLIIYPDAAHNLRVRSSIGARALSRFEVERVGQSYAKARGLVMRGAYETDGHWILQIERCDDPGA